MKKLGRYHERKCCRFCNSNDLIEVMDLGLMPLAGAFIKQKDFSDEKFYPLTLDFCNSCSLVQVKEVISADILFKENYFFFSSSINTLINHFREYANDLYNEFLSNLENPKILEIGCNDGVMLRPFSDLGVLPIGVDPATNVVKTIDIDKAVIYNDYFTEKLSNNILNEYGKLDLVVSNFSFAHIDDMQDVIKGITTILKDDGVFVFEIYYLVNLIEEMNYDMIYHEHMSYYSLYTLTKFFNEYNMEVFEIKHNKEVRTGSTRFYVKFNSNSNLKISDNVNKVYSREINLNYHKKNIYNEYASKVELNKNQTIDLLKKLKSEGKSIIGYGASGRGTVIMNYCKIDSRYLDYVVDDAPQKVGFFTPGTRLEIKSWDYVLENGYPDYIILFAWSFTEEVIKKRQDFIQNGGKFIVPLPTLTLQP